MTPGRLLWYIDYYKESASTLKAKQIAELLGNIAALLYFIIGLIQMVAVYAFFRNYGWWMIPSIIIAPIISLIDIIGPITATVAAAKVWGWSTIGSAVLFFCPLTIFLLMVALIGQFSDIFLIVRKKKHNQRDINFEK